MLRATLNNIEGLLPEHLPPMRREGPLRLLVLNMGQFGFKTFGQNIRDVLARRDDVDALNIVLNSSGLMRYTTRRLPFARGWDLPLHRYHTAWRMRLRRWLSGPLAMSHFDVIFLSPTRLGAAALDVMKRTPEMEHPKIVLCSDSTMIGNQREFPGEVIRWRGPLIEWERYALSGADLIAMRSEWARSSVHRDYGVPDRGQSYALLPPIHIPARSRLDEPVERPGLVKIALVGNTFERKGGPRLVRWHQERWRGKVELHLVSRTAPADGSLEGVRSYASIPNEKLVNEFFPSMDIFCLPTMQDQLAWVNAEAAAAGLPIVASRMAAIPEVVLEGESGYTVALDDGAGFIARLEELIEDPQKRRRFGERARAHAVANLNAAKSYDGLVDRMIGLVGG